jgi:hypothetical protein
MILCTFSAHGNSGDNFGTEMEFYLPNIPHVGDVFYNENEGEYLTVRYIWPKIDQNVVTAVELYCERSKTFV